MHLHKNEVVLGSLQPLVWRSFWQQLTAPIPWLLPFGPLSGCCRGAYSLGREVGIAFFHYHYCYLCVCVCVCVCVCMWSLCVFVCVFNNGSLNNWFMYLLFLLFLMFFFVLLLKFLKGKKFFIKRKRVIVVICSSSC